MTFSTVIMDEHLWTFLSEYPKVTAAPPEAGHYTVDINQITQRTKIMAQQPSPP